MKGAYAAGEPASSYPTNLSCPHPGCDGSIAQAALTDRLVVCPRCQRLSARCTRTGGETGLCPTLNRPLARFCRHCQHALEIDWPWAEAVRDTWFAGAGAGLFSAGGAERPMALGELTPVLSLHEALPPDPWKAWPMELVDAGGRLWIGASDGRYLFVEPFADRMARPTLVREQFGAGHRGSLRACISSSWMLMYADQAIRVLNLLELSAPSVSGQALTTLWSAKEGQRLLAPPMLLQAPAGQEGALASQDRMGLWLLHDAAQGFVLQTNRLSLLTRKVGGPVWRFPEDRERGLALTDAKEKVLLVRAPLGRRESILLVLRHSLWLLDLPEVSSDRALTRKLLFKGRRIVRNIDDLPGVVFVPGPRYGTAEGGGTIFLTCEEEDGTRTLMELNLAADGTVSPPIPHDYRGIPFDLLEGDALPGALCQSGQTLTLCDARQRHIPLGSSTHLDGLTRGHVYGRLAACSGMVVEGGHPHWFLVLMDLWRRQIIQQISWPRPASHPVLIGKYVFTIEDVPPGRSSRAGLCLVRRELYAPESAAAAPAGA